MPIKVDYTPVGALSKLAEQGGQVAGQWQQSQLDLAREQLAQHDRDVVQRNKLAEQQMSLKATSEQAKAQALSQRTAYTDKLAEEKQTNLERHQKTGEEQAAEKQQWAEGLPERELQKQMQAAELQNAKFTYQYSEKQRLDMKKYQDEITDVRNRIGKDLNEEQAKRLEEQLWMGFNKIKGTPQQVFDPTPATEEIAEKQKIHPRDGSAPTTYFNAKTGKIELLPEIKEQNDNQKHQVEQQQKKEEAAAKREEERLKLKAQMYHTARQNQVGQKPTKNDGTPNPAYRTPEQSMAEIEEAFKMVEPKQPVSQPTQTDYENVISPENSNKISSARQNGLISDEELQTINQVLMQDPSKIDQILAVIEAGKIRK